MCWACKFANVKHPVKIFQILPPLCERGIYFFNINSYNKKNSPEKSEEFLYKYLKLRVAMLKAAPDKFSAFVGTVLLLRRRLRGGRKQEKVSWYCQLQFDRLLRLVSR